MQHDRSALVDIAHATRLAMDFVQNMDYEDFLSDLKTQSAVMLQIILIGEAARRTSVEFRVINSNLPWPQMMGMRNRLIHEYDKIKLDMLWSTMKEDFPPLLISIEKLLSE